MSPHRDQLWRTLEDDPRFDVVVIGGGVNGIGTYRDLALQGLRVLLVERNDFASGCSAAPSRMIHGGLRYLENGEFGLVRESLRERDALRRNAAHMVRPLPTLIPIGSLLSGSFNSLATFLGRGGKPAPRGALPIKLGLTLYDRISRAAIPMPRHRLLGARATRARWPDLTPAARLSAIYHDAWISHPERLCLEMIRDMETAAPGCVALNYTTAARHGDGLRVSCGRSGREAAARAGVIVHATGAWIDESMADFAAGTGERLVEGTKGSHLILDAPALHDALDGHMVYFENGDGRVCITFPYLGRVLAGSTDIRVERAGRTRCSDEERDYILDSLRLVFPGIAVLPGQVLFSYSGIRPLPRSEESFTGRISRDHSVRVVGGQPPQVCMIGGKWTTFRAFAEQATDAVLGLLGQVRRRSTLDLAIGGGVGLAPVDDPGTRVPLADRTAHLRALYGSGAETVAEFCRTAGTDTLLDGTLYSRAEIIRMIRHERVCTLSDIVLRRTDLAIRGIISLRLIADVADIFARETGSPGPAARAEAEALIDELDRWYGVSRDMLARRDTRERDGCE